MSDQAKVSLDMISRKNLERCVKRISLQAMFEFFITRQASYKKINEINQGKTHINDIN